MAMPNIPDNTKLVSNALKTTTDALDVATVVFLANQIVRIHAQCLEIIGPQLAFTVRQIAFWLENYAVEATLGNFDALQANVRLFNALQRFSVFEQEYETAMQRVGYLVRAVPC